MSPSTGTVTAWKREPVGGVDGERVGEDRSGGQAPGRAAGLLHAGDDLDLLGEHWVVVTDAAGERRARLTTLHDAAEHVGVALGAPEGIYGVVTSAVDPTASLALDPGAAATIAVWFALGDEALRAFAPDVEGGPSTSISPSRSTR